MSVDHPVERLTRARLRRLQRLRSAKGRKENAAFLIDGGKLVADAVTARAPILEILSRDPDRWLSSGLPTTQISQADAERLSDTNSPQGHFAVVQDSVEDFRLPTSQRWQVVALDAVQDAGNVGGIIRSSAAFGVDCVVVGAGSADPTHPRVTRAATGAWFHVETARALDLGKALQQCKSDGATIIAADTCGDPLEQVKAPKRVVWLFGNEGAGISEALSPLIDRRVAIPIAAHVDSLNVNVAAGIILHHHQQQLRKRAESKIDGTMGNAR